MLYRYWLAPHHISVWFDQCYVRVSAIWTIGRIFESEPTNGRRFTSAPGLSRWSHIQVLAEGGERATELALVATVLTVSNWWWWWWWWWWSSVLLRATTKCYYGAVVMCCLTIWFFWRIQLHGASCPLSTFHLVADLWSCPHLMPFLELDLTVLILCT